MLGHELARLASAAGHEVTPLGRPQLDVTDAGAAREWAAEAHPEVVVNCAAWTDVDGAEEHEADATHLNGTGARNIAAAAAAGGAKVVYISTDYVFDGTKADGYVETDQPAPLSAYGRSKLAGEQATQAANPRHFVLRTSWLFGAHGRNFVDSMLQRAQEGEALRVVDDQVGCPTWTRHLAEAILALSAGEDYGVHHLAGAGQTSWYGFAREIFRRAGVDARLEPCATSEFPRPAPRPAYSILRSARGRSLPPWEAGLEGYLNERVAV